VLTPSVVMAQMSIGESEKNATDKKQLICQQEQQAVTNLKNYGYLQSNGSVLVVLSPTIKHLFNSTAWHGLFHAYNTYCKDITVNIQP
jgi:hypothetical protein